LASCHATFTISRSSLRAHIAIASFDRLQDNGHDHKSTELIMPSITLSSLITGLIQSRAEEERLFASDAKMIAPLGAASDKKSEFAGAHRATTSRNIHVRPAWGKSDSHLQAHIAGLKSLCVLAKFGVINNLARLCQRLPRKKE
jgi:hypothetical protein